MEKRQETVLEGHKSGVTSIAIASYNKYIISGGDYGDCTIRIWNFLEKRQETVLEGHTSPINSIAITSDNKYIISGSNDKQFESGISWRKTRNCFRGAYVFRKKHSNYF